MTTTPNDAAVNAESAAKLVSDEILEIALDAFDQVYDAECSRGAYADNKKSAIRYALEAVAITLIERHATPQTQATHGEGEAVGYVDRTGLEMVRAGTLETLLMHGRKRRVDYAPLYTHPAPSPTAALSETEKWEGLAQHFEGLASETRRDAEPGELHDTVALAFEQCANSVRETRDGLTICLPDPTAAPALGELAKAVTDEQICAAYDVIFHSDPNKRLTKAERVQAALEGFVASLSAALSGVAAQGDVLAAACAMQNAIEHLEPYLRDDNAGTYKALCDAGDRFVAAMAAQKDAPRFDEAQFAEMTRKGAEAWKDVPDVAVWINEQRGAQEGGVPKGWTIAPQGDAILVRGPGGDAYLSDEKHNSPVSVIVLFRLAKALLAAKGDGEQFSEDEEKEWADITKGLPHAPYEHPTFREAEIAVLTGKWPSREPQQQSIVKQGDGEARVSEDAEFQLYCDDEPVAVASGPRKDALREIHHYALQYNQDGAVRIEEVIRKPLSAIENVMSLGVADQGPNIDLTGQG